MYKDLLNQLHHLIFGLPTKEVTHSQIQAFKPVQTFQVNNAKSIPNVIDKDHWGKKHISHLLLKFAKMITPDLLFTALFFSPYTVSPF